MTAALMVCALYVTASGQVQGQRTPQSKSESPAGSETDVRCGAYCLFAALKALDIDVPKFAEFERSLGPPPKTGFSLGELAAAAERYGAKTLGVSTTIANLRKRDQRFACIALVNRNHFVNVKGISDQHVQMIDPSSRSKLGASSDVPHDTWKTLWDGTALLIGREPLVPEEDLPRDVSWTNLAGYAGLALGGLLILLIAARAIKKR